jgi:hypothetical protein
MDEYKYKYSLVACSRWEELCLSIQFGSDM